MLYHLSCLNYLILLSPILIIASNNNSNKFTFIVAFMSDVLYSVLNIVSPNRSS